MDLVRKAFIIFAALTGLVALPVAAEAKGCIKGVIVGGVAGHLAGHGKLGAVRDVLSDITKQIGRMPAARLIRKVSQYLQTLGFMRQILLSNRT